MSTQPQGTVCRGCGSHDTARVVDLGEQAASDQFPALDDPVPDGRWPLELWLCGRCALVQLGNVEPQLPALVRAVESDTSREHARRTVAAVLAEHPDLASGVVLEFASHHGGSWMDHLVAAGGRVAGPDEKAQLVVDVHALAHERDVERALSERAARVRDDGLLVLEFHHLLPLVLGTQFDTIRHGHWSYLSLTALQRLAADHGLQVCETVVEPVFGGSLRVTLRPGSDRGHVSPSVQDVLAAEDAAGVAAAPALHALDDRARRAAAELASFLTRQKREGRRVLAYGAPSKASVLLGVSGVGPDLLPFTVDASPAKHGLAIPGVRIPIRPVTELVAAAPDVVLVLTWDIADEVIGKLETAGGWGAEYVVPLPTPHRVAM
jgi:C-methyltransferase C-terminal domain/Putative zinc binding domain